MTLQDSISTFLAGLEDSRYTQETYKTGLKRFCKFMESRVERAPLMDDLYDQMLLDFQLWLNPQHQKASVKVYVAATMKWLGNALIRNNLPPSFNLERAKAIYKDAQRRSPYHARDPQEFNNVPLVAAHLGIKPEKDEMKTGHAKHVANIQYLVALRNRAFALFIYATPTRQGEARTLLISQVRNPDKTIKNLIYSTGKGDKEDFTVFNNPEARQALQDYLDARADTSRYLFISHARNYGEPITRNTAWEIIKSASREIGEEYSPHDFRHHWAIQAINSGKPLEIVQAAMRHSSPNTTSRTYAKLFKHTIISQVEDVKMPSVMGEG